MTRAQHTVRFLGGAGTVTGSRFLIETGPSRVLVDADQLLAWVKAAPTPPRMTYLVHGEDHAADRMRFRIEHELGWPVRVAEHNEEIDLENPR